MLQQDASVKKCALPSQTKQVKLHKIHVQVSKGAAHILFEDISPFANFYQLSHQIINGSEGKFKSDPIYPSFPISPLSEAPIDQLKCRITIFVI